MNLNLFHGDCLTVLANYPDECVDLVITDPPYKTTKRGNASGFGGFLDTPEMHDGKGGFKENAIKISEFLPELYRLLRFRTHCLIMCNQKNLTEFLLTVKESKFHFIKMLTWAKDNKIASQSFMSQTEFILFLRKGSHKKINDCSTSDLLQYRNLKHRGSTGKPTHPTSKPVKLFKKLIFNCSDPGDLVLDPFMGSGTAGEACKELERAFMGIELDELYFSRAKQRLLGEVRVDQFEFEHKGKKAKLFSLFEPVGVAE